MTTLKTDKRRAVHKWRQTGILPRVLESVKLIGTLVERKIVHYNGISHSTQTRLRDTAFMLAVSKTEPWRQRLVLPNYGIGEAARYSHISPQTVSHWRRGMPGYEKGQRLSYLDLIEVAVIAAFRKSGVSLQRIRKARDYASNELDSQHPFVQYRWQAEGFHMMLRLSEIDSHTSIDNLVVADAHGQIAWPEMVFSLKESSWPPEIFIYRIDNRGSLIKVL